MHTSRSAGCVAITISSGLDPKTWGTLPTLFTGAAFTLGLVLVVMTGSDLATGDMMLVPLGAMRGKIGMSDVVRNLTLVLIGDLLGALFVASSSPCRPVSSVVRTPLEAVPKA